MRILHFIDSLDYGGAETLLMSYIPLLDDYEHTVVTLNGPNVYKKINGEYIQLNIKPVKGFIGAVRRLRKIITQKKIDIVHTHSFWTNIISRLATPRGVRLFNHYHFADYDTMKHRPAVKKMILIDKISSRKSLTRIAVSEYVAKILRNTFPKATIKVIPNFINCMPAARDRHEARWELKVIAVGNCNTEKNYSVVLQAFEALKDEPIKIDIIGGGEFLEMYRGKVKASGLEKVYFYGFEPNVREKLLEYDLFLSASVSETFGIAVLEAVCAKLPLLLSAIPAFKEIAPKDACFFNPSDKDDLILKLKGFLNDCRDIDYSDYERVLQKYSAQNFVFELRNLYN